MQRSPEEIKDIKAEISERYGMVFPNIALEPIRWGRRKEESKLIDGNFAIIDRNTDACFNICTDLYKPIPYEVTIKDMEMAAAALPEYGKPTITVKLIKDGARMSVNMKFEEIKHEVKTGDIVNPTAEVKSSYDLFWKLLLDFGAFRLVCSNGMKIGEVLESFKKRHLTSLDDALLINTLGKGMENFSEQTKLWSKYAEQKVDALLYEDLWTELPFSKPEREKIEQTKSEGDGVYLLESLKANELTRWDFLNVITAYTTHNIASEMRQIELGPKVAQVFERKFYN